jgi:hypothetical protein
MTTRSTSRRRGGEEERLAAGGVEPLRVIDQAHHRRVLSRLGQRAERGDSHQEPVGTAGRVDADRRPQRAGVVVGETVQTVEHRPQQLVQGGEGQLGLGLSPPSTENLHIADPAHGVLQQRRLTDAGLTPDDEDTAVRRRACLNEGGQYPPFGIPAVERQASDSRCHLRFGGGQ